jgi:hypothetical protein
VDLGDEAVELWHDLDEVKAKLKELEAVKEQRYAAVIAMLQDAEGGRLPDGSLITYLDQRSPVRCDTTRLRALHPDIFDLLCSDGRHRVLRLKAAKKGRD